MKITKKNTFLEPRAKQTLVQTRGKHEKLTIHHESRCKPRSKVKIKSDTLEELILKPFNLQIPNTGRTPDGVIT